MGVFFDPTKRDLMTAAWKNHSRIVASSTATINEKLASLFATFMLAVGVPQEREMKRVLRSVRLDELVFRGQVVPMPTVKFTPRKDKVDGPLGRRWAEDPANADFIGTVVPTDIERDFDPNLYLGDLVGIIRNAIAHGHIRYSLDEDQNETVEIKMANINNHKVRDVLTISYKHLESLTEYCVELASSQYQSLETLATFFPIKK